MTDARTPGAQRKARTVAAGAVPSTEFALAQTFAQAFADRLRYDHTAGAWYVWNGTCWRRDTVGKAHDMARVHCLLASQGTEKHQRAATVRNVLELASRMDPLAVDHGAWDTDPWLLGTPGGIVDLRTGALRRPAPEALITKVTAVAPAAPGVVPALWTEFLSFVADDDRERPLFLQRFLGYCLTGDVREHVLMFLWGGGGNGKSVLLNTVLHILADYGRVSPVQTFTSGAQDRHPVDKAMLAGARLVAANETEQGRAWAEAELKSLTGGDPITARFMHKNPFTFLPTFKLLIVGNHRPTIQSVDDAMRRRLVLVPFNRKPAAPDPELEAKLRAEAPAILRWMIDGCLDWQAHGLPRPAAIAAATADYFEAQDSVGLWLSECCEVGPTLHDSSRSLFQSWESFQYAAGEHPGSGKSLTEALKKRGFEQFRSSIYRGFRGLRVRSSGVSDPRDRDGWVTHDDA